METSLYPAKPKLIVEELIIGAEKITYIGKCDYGAGTPDTSKATWSIKRFIETNGGANVVASLPQNPDSLQASDQFIFVWDDRDTLDYM